MLSTGTILLKLLNPNAQYRFAIKGVLETNFFLWILMSSQSSNQ